MGHLVRNTAEHEATSSGHTAVAHDDQVRPRVGCNPNQRVGSVARHAVRPGVHAAGVIMYSDPLLSALIRKR